MLLHMQQGEGGGSSKGHEGFPFLLSFPKSQTIAARKRKKRRDKCWSPVVRKQQVMRIYCESHESVAEIRERQSEITVCQVFSVSVNLH